MKSEVITNKNFLLYCAKHYNNPNCVGIAEFKEDLQRIKYIKKLITRYTQTGELKERHILNHIIVLNNMFGPEALIKISFLKMKNQMMYLKPFFILLNIWPEVVYNVEKEGNIIYTDDIPMEQEVIEALRKI